MKRRHCKIVDIMIVFVIICFLPAVASSYEKEVDAISRSIGERIESLGKKKIAVVDFTDLQGNVTELGRFLAEELSVSITMNFPNLEVIDRTHLKTLLQEHALSISGLTDPSNVQKLGQIAGTEAIITGTVTPFGDNVRLTAKVIATDTAKVIAADKIDIAKTKAIEELLTRGIASETKLEVTTQTAVTPSETEAPQATSTHKPVTVATPTPASPPPWIVESGIFTFEYLGGYFDGDRLVLDVAVTAQKDTRLRIHRSAYTRLFDPGGREYRTSAAQIGSEYDAYVNVQKVENSLVSGVPTRISLFFNNVSQDLRWFTLLEIGYSTNGSIINVRFRNLPLRFAWLGVNVQDLTPEMTEKFGLQEVKGVFIANVTKDGPADKAGIKKGDVLLKLDGREIFSGEQFLEEIRSHNPGDVVQIEVWRNREIVVFEATLG